MLHKTDKPTITDCFSPIQQDVIDRLISEAVAAALYEAAVLENEQWNRCFGPSAPTNKAEQLSRIVKTSSARALCAKMALRGSR